MRNAHRLFYLSLLTLCSCCTTRVLVIDGDGIPVSNAFVVATHSSMSPLYRSRQHVTITDADGYACIDGQWTYIEAGRAPYFPARAVATGDFYVAVLREMPDDFLLFYHVYQCVRNKETCCGRKRNASAYWDGLNEYVKSLIASNYYDTRDARMRDAFLHSVLRSTETQ